MIKTKNLKMDGNAEDVWINPAYLTVAAWHGWTSFGNACETRVLLAAFADGKSLRIPQDSADEFFTDIRIWEQKHAR